MKNNSIASLKQFILFGLVGITNTIILLTVYYVFIWINPRFYLIGNTLGFILAVLNSFLLNRKFVFKFYQGKTLTPLLKTFVVNVFILLIQTLLLWLFIEVFLISERIAPLMNVVITMPINFFLNKNWSFKTMAQMKEVKNE